MNNEIKLLVLTLITKQINNQKFKIATNKDFDLSRIYQEELDELLSAKQFIIDLK